MDRHNAGWRNRADIRRQGFIDAGKFNEESSIWSEVKPVFMSLQHNKCVFCERVLGGELTGKAEHDVEHYRPKGRVMKWPYPSRKPKVSYTFGTGTPNKTGYFWLAYDIENYACACKGCNSDPKRDYFPVLNERGTVGQDGRTLNTAEIPLLLFPHGECGDDPAQYITFEGVIAKAIASTGLANQRAQVTIDFFSLNDRDELLADRARVIRELFKAIKLSTSEEPEMSAAATRDITQIISDASPQAACARAYLELVKSDYQKAWEIYLGVDRYLK